MRPGPYPPRLALAMACLLTPAAAGPAVPILATAETPVRIRVVPGYHRAVDGPRPPVDRGPGRVCRRLDPRRDGARPSRHRARGRDRPRWDRRPRVRRPRRAPREYAGARADVPVEVRRASAIDPLRFRNDVMPVFTKAGCNTGKCHGSTSGKDGFRLSLFGYDPEGDHFRLTREAIGRRVDLAAPADCLLMNKATGKVAHTGGRKLEPSGEGYRLVLAWLESGAPADPAGISEPIGIDVFPGRAVFASPGEAQRLVVRAALLRRHRPRRHPLYRLPEQERRRRRRGRPGARRRHAGPARRSSSPGSTSSRPACRSSSDPARRFTPRGPRPSTGSTRSSTPSSTVSTWPRRRSAPTRPS